MKHALLFTLLSMVLTPLSASGQVSEKQFKADLDGYIRKTMDTVPEVPSVAMVVVKGDKPIFMQAYGVANKETGQKADVNTLYYIASSTKSYMALAAAQLDREGKIKLSDPITKYLSGVQFKSSIPEKVTVRDLLTHTSALRNGALAWRMAYSGEIDDRDMMRVLAEGTTFTDAGYGKYAYTNLGYNIYAMLLSMSAGKKWQDVLEEKVFRPLGMKSTTAYVSKARAAKLPMAESYLFAPEANAIVRSPIDKQDNNMQSAGGIVTSLSDAARWLSFNINSGKLDGKQLIPAEIVQSVHTGYADVTRSEPPFTGQGKYGLGWQLGKYRDENIVYHFGGYPGWSCHISYMPDKQIGVAVFINESTAGGRVGHLLATYAYDKWLGRADVDASYASELETVAGEYGKFKQGTVAAVKSRASRTSQLTRPLSEYAGRYTNELLGNFDIVVEQNSLGVKMGYIHIISTPFTQKDVIRVELLPGQGETIEFRFNSDGKIDSLTYGGMKFKRIG
jgi:CubicO group peptidase (beta-lactamase class C family)